VTSLDAFASDAAGSSPVAATAGRPASAVVRRVLLVAVGVALSIAPGHAAAAPTLAEDAVWSAPRAVASPIDTGTVSVTIPDLSAALTDEAAPWGLRRAACHQVTGLDDESDPVLAACLRSIRP
jgi:hypothetical protein